MTGRPSDLHRQPGDGWLECTCGSRHWGLHGAAGLLLVRTVRMGSSDDEPEVVLQHRAEWSDHGGTWGIPGGALAPGESAVTGALREAHEEAGIDPQHLRVDSTHVLDHGPWSYTTVVATSTGPQHPRPTDPESLEIAWVTVSRVARLPLLPAFAAAWPGLRARIETDAAR